VGRRLRDVDLLFFNEPHFTLEPWYEAPFFSESALADFRRYCNDPQARFPAKAWAQPTPRTDNQATIDDWRRWEDWLAHVYARMIATQCEGFARAQQEQNNARYGGAIWFQNVDWVGPRWATDLDLIAAVEGVRYLVAEYCTDETSPDWRKFKYYAHKHRKWAATFVNVGHYDAKSPGGVRYEGTDEGFERAAGLGVREHAALLCAYPMWSFYPWSPAYHAARVEAWDRQTAAAVGR
jgi:hypothetical protein